jgi:hypothetical protein
LIRLHFPRGFPDSGSPRVFILGGPELQMVRDVTLLPGGLCRFTRFEDPVRLDEAGLATVITAEDTYCVTVGDEA